MRWLRLLIFAVTAPWTVAATFTWSGGAGDRVLTNPANWSGGVVPPSDGTAVLVFGDTGAGKVQLPSSFNVAQVQFTTSASTQYTFTTSSGATLTLQNGVVGSANGGRVVFASSLSLNIAHNQTFAVGAGVIEVDGSVVGTGSLVKTGSGNLQLLGFNTWTGGLTQTAGVLSLSNGLNLGSGLLHLAGGELAIASQQDAFIPNAVALDGPTTLSASARHFVVFGGPVTLTTSASLSASGASAFFFTGAVTESGGARQLTVTGLAPVVLTGTSTYTGGTKVDNGALIFGTSEAVPTTGKINASSLGYVGVAFTDNVQSNLLDRLNGSDFHGIIGFDTAPWQGGPTTFGSNIDLTNLPNYASLGSHTSATLGGNVVVQNNADYRFGGGGGTLYLEGNLTARGNNLQVVSPFGQPLTLVLQGNNTYKGNTNVLYSVLVLDRENTLPQSSALNLTGPGYVGYTENTSFSANGFLGRIGSINSPDAIAGIDAATTAGRTVSDSVDLSLGGTRTNPYYLGTSSKVTLTGTITPTIGDALYLTAVKGGHLTIASQLGSNIPGLVVGQTNSFDPQGGIVELTAANRYTNGTDVRGGTLRVSNSAALGLGGVAVASGATLDVSRGVSVANLLTFSSGARLSGGGIIASPGGTTIGPGVILSPGGLNAIGSLGFTSGLTLAGGGVLELDIRTLGTSAPGWDTFYVVGAPLAINADGSSPFNINLYSLGSDGNPGLLLAFDPTRSYSWQFASATSLTGFSADAFTIDSSNFLNGTAGGTFFVSQSGNALIINFTPVPEPSTYALFAFGLAIIGLTELRRKKK